MSMQQAVEDLVFFQRALLTQRPDKEASHGSMQLVDRGSYVEIYRHNGIFMTLPRCQELKHAFAIVLDMSDTEDLKDSVRCANMVLTLPLKIIPANALLDESVRNIPIRVEIDGNVPHLWCIDSGFDMKCYPFASRDFVYVMDMTMVRLSPFYYDMDILKGYATNYYGLTKPLSLDAKAPKEAAAGGKRRNTVFDILRSM